MNYILMLGGIFTFIITFILTDKLKDKLPADEGRDFAVDGKLSKGKPRGAGIIFILTFILGAAIFVSRLNIEFAVYYVLVFLEMITGYLDDASDKPWGRLKKGLLDLFVSIALAATYIYYNGSVIMLPGYRFELPIALFAIVIIVAAWAAINVTNCADGVDGLSGSLTIVTLMSFYLFNAYEDTMFKNVMIYFIAALAAYLWFNAGPSILMMGDAGSRAMGIFICISALKSGYLLLLIPFAIVLILDGGLGLFKVSMIKLTKKRDFMSFVRTPLHDHVRKNIEPGWSNYQTVMRFSIIQMVVSMLVLLLQ